MEHQVRQIVQSSERRFLWKYLLKKPPLNSCEFSCIDGIIKALRDTHPDADGTAIEADTLFTSVPGLDSLSVVIFQTHLASIIGQKANEVLPISDMSIAEYAEALESI